MTGNLVLTTVYSREGTSEVPAWLLYRVFFNLFFKILFISF